MDIYSITTFRAMNKQALNRRMTILAGTLLVTTLMMTAPSVFAAPVSKDFKIDTFGIDDDGNPFLTVKGTAGGTTPDEAGHIFAYAFVTDKGTFAVTSHPGIEDSDEVDDDTEWHAHKVQLSDAKPPCVTDLTEQGKAVLDGNTVSVDNTPATEVTNVLTADLVAEGDNVCVDTVFDSKP
ncbi:MAG: hypothetical protein ACRD93_09365 [Nitrososphaeraceae archaeon]|jgi:hypothetical protein